MKCLTPLILLCLIAINTQTVVASTVKTGTITGMVFDANLNQPIPYVTVSLITANEKTLTGTITDENGSFKIDKIPVGTYTMRIQFIGYETYNKQLVVKDSNDFIDLGKILLKETTTELEGVEVIAEVSSIQQKVDRKVITIGKDLAAVGTASELMVGIPSVSVDPQSGAISLRGNENVPVMVDGKLSNIPAAQLLKQIPSSAIKAIELITNPSAKYNPEGMSGIINIILHKNQLVGFNGSLSSNWSKEINSKFNSSLNLNYRNGKFNVFGNYSNNISKNNNHGNINRPNDFSEQLFAFSDDRESHIFKVGMDVYINDKNTVSVFTSQNPANSGTDGTTRTFYDKDPSKNDILLNGAHGDNHSTQYNLNYTLDFNKEGSNIELEIDHNTFEDESPVFFKYPNDNTKDYKDDNTTNRERTTINLDYVNPLTENSKLELGAETRLFNTLIFFSSTGESLNSQQMLVPAPDTKFDYTRDIYSLYATYGKNFEKWTYQLGLRAEQVSVSAIANETLTSGTRETTISPFKNDYTELYPSLFLTYSPTDKNTYQFSYSRRIDRPGINQVNPIKEWSTQLVSSYGNKELLPQLTNSFEINYTRKLKKGTVTGGVFYRLISDEINRALFVDRTDVKSGRLILTHDNFDDTFAYGLEFSTNYRPYTWWSINGSFDLFSQSQEGIAERLRVPTDQATANDIIREVNEVENVAYNFRMYNSFTATKKLSFTAFMFYRGKNKNLQFDVLPMYFVNLGARLSVLKGKGTVNIGFNDVFDTMRFRFDGRLPYNQVGAFHWESRTVQLGFNYRFGSGKYQAKSRRQRQNDEKSGGGGLL